MNCRNNSIAFLIVQWISDIIQFPWGASLDKGLNFVCCYTRYLLMSVGGVGLAVRHSAAGRPRCRPSSAAVVANAVCKTSRDVGF